MTACTPPHAPGRSTRLHRLELRVWPQTPTQPWRVELHAEGDEPPRAFDEPLALLLYLTHLPGTVACGSGLR